jgi:chromosomal replication initiator protein
LFVYGGVGLGKTHLIHALGNEVFRQNPEKVIRYVHAEDYYADVVRAYQQKSFDIFKRYYRSLDLLIIDDIQFFNNKNRTQEEFFHAFNALTEAKKQIVITCDTYPKDIHGPGRPPDLALRLGPDGGRSSRPSWRCASPSSRKRPKPSRSRSTRTFPS